MTGTTNSDSNKGKEQNGNGILRIFFETVADKAESAQPQNSKAEATEENFRPEYVIIETKCVHGSSKKPNHSYKLRRIWNTA